MELLKKSNGSLARTPKEVEQMKEFNAEEFAANVCSLSDPDCESCGS